jgi:hypothetical protein
VSFEIGTATDVADLMGKLNTFLLKGHALEPAYSGVGTGKITSLIGTANSVLETITVTFTSSTAFDVSGSVTAAMGSGTVGVAFSHANVSFTVTAGGTAWAAADTITFTMTPPWNQKRGVAGSEYIWQAPGNGNEAQIFTGILRFSDVGADYDNWRLGGFNGFDSALTFSNQPGAMTRPVVPLLRVGTMPYWFAANGRRVVMVVKASTVYESLYLGFFNQYANPNQYAYPLAVGGSMSWATTEPASSSQNWRWSYQGNEHRAFAIPHPTVSSNDDQFQLRLRRPDGVFQGFCGAAKTGGSQQGYVWPYGYSMTNLLPNLDGSYPLLPIVLHEDDSSLGIYPGITFTSPNTWGELDGVYAVTGHANAAENTITVGRTDYLVVQNVYRTTKTDFFAVKLA